MSIRKSLSLALITGLFCTSARAESPCTLGEYAPLASQPYREQYAFDYGNFSILYGAKLYVAAQPGLTREWLTRDLVLALSEPSGSTCRLPVQPVQIDVESAGGGFWVTLKARDEREGAKLASWASTLAPAVAK